MSAHIICLLTINECPRSCEIAGVFVLFFALIVLFWAFRANNILPWYKISVIMLTFAADIGQVASGGAAASEKMSE